MPKPCRCAIYWRWQHLKNVEHLERCKALVELCRKHGIYILHDEIFNGLGETGARHLPCIAGIYERGLSLNVMSKSYGLPGLRVGWIACQDAQIISKMERLKHYLSICNSGPSERLSMIALRNKDRILARNCAIVDENLPEWDAFFARHADLFDWQRPDGSCMAFPRYKGDEGLKVSAHPLSRKAACFSCLARSIHRTRDQHQRTVCGLVSGAQILMKGWPRLMRI